MSAALDMIDDVDAFIRALSDEGLLVEVVPSAKMSKSKKNVVDPMNIIASVRGRYRALVRDVGLAARTRCGMDLIGGRGCVQAPLPRLGAVRPHRRDAGRSSGRGRRDLAKATAKAIDEVTKGIEGFAFNKAIAALYGFTNTIAKANASTPTMKEAIRTLAQLMSPMTPHIAESIWTYQGGAGLCAQAPWPKADPALLVDDTVTLPIQINGKRRAEISVPKDMPAAEVEKIALADEDVIKFLAGQPVKKIIVVPGRIINVVV
jgi:leucyl-tRNA synthetase